MPRFTLCSAPSQGTVSAQSWNESIASHLSHLVNQTKASQTVWWLDICDASEEDVLHAARALNVHPLSVEDVVTREPREKVEVFRNYYLISFQTLVSKEDGVGGFCSRGDAAVDKSPSSDVLFILVFLNGVLTFSPGGCNHAYRVRDRIRKMYDPGVLSGDWICYALIDDIIDSFAPHMQAASREAESIEDQVFIVRADDIKMLVPRIDHLRKKITHLIRALSGKADVLNGFVKRCQSKHFIAGGDDDASNNQKGVLAFSPFPDGDLLLYMGDVHDHLVTTMSNLTHFDEIVSRSQSNCLSQLSATNIRLNYKITAIMSKVSVLAAIFVPLHLVTALWGMNVSVPGEDASGVGWFFGIFGVMITFVVVCCIAASRFRLL